MRRAVLILIALSGCDELFGLDPLEVPAPGWLEGYRYRKAIALTPSASLTDFTVSITANDPDLAAHASADGADFIFTERDGTTYLASELVSYARGTLDAWVRVPQLVPPSTSIYLYYGGPPSTLVAPVWSDDFAGVWHFGHVLGEADSTSHEHDLGAPPAQLPAPTDGIAGGARRYDGVDDSLCVGQVGDPSLEVGAASFSYSVWVRAGAGVDDFDMPMWKGGGNAGQRGYELELGTGGWTFNVADDVRVVQGYFGLAIVGRWVNVVVVVDRSNDMAVGYIDGGAAAQVSVSALGALSDAANLLCIGPD